MPSTHLTSTSLASVWLTTTSIAITIALLTGGGGVVPLFADASAPSVVLRDKYRTWITNDEALFRPNSASAPTLPTYAKIMDPPPGLTSFAMVEIEQGKIITFGGEMTSAEVDHEPLAKGVSGTVYRYDIESNQWYNETASYTVSPAARIDHTAWVWNNQMYIYGGANETVMGDVWSYGNRTWHRLPATYPARKGHSSEVLDTNYNATEVYIFGGIDEQDKYHDDLYILHMDGTITNITSATGTWPSRRAYHASSLMRTEYEGTLIFIHGGTDGNEIFSDLYVYYTINNTWSYLSSGSTPALKAYDSAYIPSLETERAMKHDCVSMFPILYCVGGVASGDPISMIFDITLGRWVRPYYTNEDKLLPLQGHRMMIYQTPMGNYELISVGGVSGRPAKFINEKGIMLFKADMFPEECPYEYVNGDWEGRCFLCQAGFGANRTLDPHRCFTCSAGTYSGKGRCLDCPPSTYNPIAGASNVSQCLNCPAGYFTVDSGANSSSLCVTCDPGTYAIQGQCQGCPAGTFGTVSGAIYVDEGCTPCPFGTYSRIGQTSCVTCPAGTSGGEYVSTYDPTELYVLNFVQSTSPGGCSTAVRDTATDPIFADEPFYITIAVRDHGTDGDTFALTYAPLNVGFWQSSLRVHMDYTGNAEKVHYNCQSILDEPLDCNNAVLPNVTTPEISPTTGGQSQTYVCDGSRIFTYRIRIADAGVNLLRFYSTGIRTVSVNVTTVIRPYMLITKMEQTTFLASYVYKPFKVLAWANGNRKEFLNYTGTTSMTITARCTEGVARFSVDGGAARTTQTIFFENGVWMPDIYFTEYASGCTLLGFDRFGQQILPQDTTPFEVQVLVGFSIRPLNNVSQHGILRAEIRGITDQGTLATADSFSEYLVYLNQAVQMARDHKIFISESRVVTNSLNGIAIAQMHVYSTAARLNFSTYGKLEALIKLDGVIAPTTNVSVKPFYVRPVNGTRLRIVELTHKIPSYIAANTSFPLEVELVSNRGEQDSSRDFDVELTLSGCTAKLIIVNISHWGPNIIRLKAGHGIIQVFVQGQDTQNCVIGIRETAPNKRGTIGTYSRPFEVISPKKLGHSWTCGPVIAGPIYQVNVTLLSVTNKIVNLTDYGVMMEPAGNSSAAIEYEGMVSRRLVDGEVSFYIQYRPSIVPVRVVFWAGVFKTVPVYNYTYQYYPYYQRFATLFGYEEIFVKVAQIQTATMCPQIPVLKASWINVLSRIPVWIEHNQLFEISVEAVDVFGVRDPNFHYTYNLRIKGCGGSINDEMAWTWSTDDTGYSELAVLPGGSYQYRMLSTDFFSSTRATFAYGYAKFYVRPTFTVDTNINKGVEGCEIQVSSTEVTTGYITGFDVRHTYPACRTCEPGTFSYGGDGRYPSYTVFHPGGCIPCMSGTFSAATGATDETYCEVCLGNYGWNTGNSRNDIAAEGQIRCSNLCTYGSTGRVGGGYCISSFKWETTSPTHYGYRGRTHIGCASSTCSGRSGCPGGEFRINCGASPVLNDKDACLWEGLNGTCTWNTTSNQCQGPIYTCLPCITGYGREYWTSTDGNQTCRACNAGGWQTEEGGRTDIDTDTYYYTFQRFYCPSGTYAGSTFRNVCGGSDRHECPNGTYSGTVGATSSDTCQICPSGHYCHQVRRYRANCNNIASCIIGINSNLMCPDTGGCYTCPLSSYVINGLYSPIPCPVGTYSNFTNRNDPSTCLRCPAGTYCPIGSSYPITTDTLDTRAYLDGNITPSAVSFYGSSDVISCSSLSTDHGSGYVLDGHFSEYATYAGRNGGSNYVQDSAYVPKWTGSFYYVSEDVSGSTASSLSVRTNSSIGAVTQRVELSHEWPVDMVVRAYIQFRLDDRNLSGVVPPSEYIVPFVGLEVTVTYVEEATGFSNDSESLVQSFPTPDGSQPEDTWHLMELPINPTRPIKYVTINLASRGFYSGYVLFDDVSLRPTDSIVCKCSTGFFFNNSIDAVGNECQRCKPGYACSGGTIIRCVDSWSTSAFAGCQYCRDGWLCDSDGRGRHIACEPYTYKDNATEQCFPCPNGYACKDGIKYSCHNGFYGAGGKECIPCQPGFYSVAGSPQEQCTRCPAGTTSMGARSSCFACPINHYSPDGTCCYSAPTEYFVPSIGASEPKSCTDIVMDNYTVSIPRNRHGFVIRVIPYVCELYYSYEVTRYEHVSNQDLGSIRISTEAPAILYDAGPHNYPDSVHVFKVFFTSNVKAVEQYSTVTVTLTNTPIQGVDDYIWVPHPREPTTYRITTFPANDVNLEHDWVWIQSVSAPVALNTTPMTAGVPRVAQWDMTQDASNFVGVDYIGLHPALYVILPAGFRGPMHIRPITFDQYCATPNDDCLETNPHSLIRITARTQPPVAVDDYFRVQIGRVEPIDVLANDYDPENDVLTIIETTRSTRSNYLPPIQDLCPTTGITGCLNPTACSTDNLYGGTGTLPTQCQCFYANLEDRCRTYYPDDQSLTFVDFTGNTGVCGLESFTYTIQSNDGQSTATTIIENYLCYCQGSQYTNNDGFDMIFLLDGTTSVTDFDFQLAFVEAIFERSEEGTKFRVGIIEVGANRPLWNLSTTYPDLELLKRHPYGDDTAYTLGHALNMTQTMIDTFPGTGVRPVWLVTVSGHQSTDETAFVRTQVPGARLMTVTVDSPDGKDYLHFEDDFSGSYISKIDPTYESLASDKETQEEAMDTMCSS